MIFSASLSDFLGGDLFYLKFTIRRNLPNVSPSASALAKTSPVFQPSTWVGINTTGVTGPWGPRETLELPQSGVPGDIAIVVPARDRRGEPHEEKL